MKWTLRLINNAAFLLVIRGTVLQQLSERDSSARLVTYAHSHTPCILIKTLIFIKKKKKNVTVFFYAPMP